MLQEADEDVWFSASSVSVASGASSLTSFQSLDNFEYGLCCNKETACTNYEVTSFDKNELFYDVKYEHAPTRDILYLTKIRDKHSAGFDNYLNTENLQVQPNALLHKSTPDPPKSTSLILPHKPEEHNVSSLQISRHSKSTQGINQTCPQLVHENAVEYSCGDVMRSSGDHVPRNNPSAERGLVGTSVERDVPKHLNIKRHLQQLMRQLLNALNGERTFNTNKYTCASSKQPFFDIFTPKKSEPLHTQLTNTVHSLDYNSEYDPVKLSAQSMIHKSVDLVSKITQHRSVRSAAQMLINQPPCSDIQNINDDTANSIKPKTSYEPVRLDVQTPNIEQISLTTDLNTKGKQTEWWSAGFLRKSQEPPQRHSNLLVAQPSTPSPGQSLRTPTQSASMSRSEKWSIDNEISSSESRNRSQSLGSSQEPLFSNYTVTARQNVNTFATSDVDYVSKYDSLTSAFSSKSSDDVSVVKPQVHGEENLFYGSGVVRYLTNIPKYNQPVTARIPIVARTESPGQAHTTYCPIDINAFERETSDRALSQLVETNCNTRCKEVEAFYSSKEWKNHLTTISKSPSRNDNIYTKSKVHWCPEIDLESPPGMLKHLQCFNLNQYNRDSRKSVMSFPKIHRLARAQRQSKGQSGIMHHHIYHRISQSHNGEMAMYCRQSYSDIGLI